MTHNHASGAAAAGARVLRVHEAAGLALLQFVDASTGTARSEWVSLAQAPPAPPASRAGAGRLDLDERRALFQPAVFELVKPPPAAPPTQNLVVFLHGRGDSHAPFARLGERMALPQTAVLSLQAPLELPFGLGRTWLRDLDERDGSDIPPSRADGPRSKSLDMARDFVWRFLTTLRDQFGWDLARVFLFGFSQGAAVAFHAALTGPERLGGAVLVAGGGVKGSHTQSYGNSEAEAATPVLLVAGDKDEVYPLTLSQESRRQYGTAFPQAAGAFECEVIPGKRHGMIKSPSEMRVVMAFLAKRLHLLSSLEQRDDVVQMQ